MQSFSGMLLEPVKVKRGENNQITFQVPDRLAPQFPFIFDEMDRDPDSYGIAKYSVRVSTLEEVFIEIGNKEKQLDKDEHEDLLKRVSYD